MNNSRIVKSTAVIVFLFLFLFSFSATPSQPASVSTDTEDSLFPYKGISIPYNSIVAVSDEDLELVIGLELSYLGIYSEKPVGYIADAGDCVSLQYTDSNRTDTILENYILGSCELGEKFDEQLIGMQVGEKKTVSIYDETTLSTKSYTICILRLQSPAKTLTEEIAAKYYNCSASEAIAQLKQMTEDNRIWDYIYTQILNNSSISILNAECERYVQSCIATVQQDATSQNMTLNEYLQTFELTLDELIQQYKDFYTEMQIFKRLAQQEGVVYSSGDLAEYLQQLSPQFGMSSEDILQYYGEEYIYYLMYSDYIKELAVRSAILVYE